MNNEQDLQVVKPDDAGAIQRNEPSVMQIISEVAKNMTPDNVAALEKLVDLQIKMEDRQAERQFNMAFVALQDEIKPIKAIHAVPDKQGNTKFMVAKPEEVLDAVNPLLAKHGFSVSFPMEPVEGGRIKVTVELRHRGGHMTRTPFSCRIGSGPPGCTEFQADGAAATYAKIRALCNCLNISIERAFDNDPKSLGTNITKEQAEQLQHRVKMLGDRINERKFLIYLDVQVGPNEAPALAHYQQILTGRYNDADEQLSRKENPK